MVAEAALWLRLWSVIGLGIIRSVFVRFPGSSELLSVPEIGLVLFFQLFFFLYQLAVSAAVLKSHKVLQIPIIDHVVIVSEFQSNFINLVFD